MKGKKREKFMDSMKLKYVDARFFGGGGV